MSVAAGICSMARMNPFDQSRYRPPHSMTTPRNRDRSAQLPFLRIDERAARPLYEQIYEGIREHIMHGRLRPGARVASSRALARNLGVSRFTVVTAFESLQSEGYLTTTERGGV